MRRYLLDENHKPYPVEDVPTWDRAFGEMDNHVGLTDIGEFRVSTVFLGVDHNWNLHGPPILFETMIFGPGVDGDYQERCCTWEQAQLMHDQGVQWVKHKQPDHKPHSACYYCQEEGLVDARDT